MKNIFIVTILSVLSFNAFSVGKVHNAKVIKIRIDASGKGFVYFDKQLTDTPANCTDYYDSHLAFDTTTAGGQGILSLAISAQATGKSIDAYGKGKCDVYGQIESWGYGFLK